MITDSSHLAARMILYFGRQTAQTVIGDPCTVYDDKANCANSIRG